MMKENNTSLDINTSPALSNLLTKCCRLQTSQAHCGPHSRYVKGLTLRLRCQL